MPAVEGSGNTDLIDLLLIVLTLRSSLIHQAAIRLGELRLSATNRGFGNDDDSHNDGSLSPVKEATTVIATGRQPIRRFA